MINRLLRLAIAVLTRWGDGELGIDEWADDRCRCRHRRSAHYGRCTKCGCPRFRLLMVDR